MNVICKIVEKLENPFVFRKHCNWIIFFQLSWFECLNRKNFWYIVLNDYEYTNVFAFYFMLLKAALILTHMYRPHPYIGLILNVDHNLILPVILINFLKVRWFHHNIIGKRLLEFLRMGLVWAHTCIWLFCSLKLLRHPCQVW